ncbi:MAG TPA: HAMP domain-containing sensor histidine kinase [Opitutaceae bacterium]
MSPVSRRIFYYWIMLLLPTLLVGAVAIQLVRREEARLTKQSEIARESLRSAAEARAKLIVESSELLVGDVQTLLLDALAEQPSADIALFLAEWQRTNPLVRAAFRARPTGELLWPEPGIADVKSRNFAQRFSAALRATPPWRQDTRVKDSALGEAKPQALPSAAAPGSYSWRQEVDSNLNQSQSVRRGVQELLRNSASASNSAVFNKVPQAGLAGEGAPRPAQASGGAAPALSQVTPFSLDAVARRGWSVLMIDGRPQMLGWVEIGGEVRGVEIETAALVERLKEALPGTSREGDHYVLEQQVVGKRLAWDNVFSSPSSLPGWVAARLPLATALLPGWEVVAYLPQPYESDSGGFFGLGAVLVALLVVAILAGGSLLLMQARSSMVEAAQKTSFVANVSHEFKTPLTTIRLYSELLEQGRVRSEEQGREYLRTIGRETQRLARLVNNALDFSRLEQGRKKYARETLDLRDELGRLFQTHAPRLAETGLTLNWQLPAEPVSVVVDRDALEQILLNLLDNACKYAAEGGEVTIALEARAGGGAVVRVADRGPGVPAEQREKIFEKFHRVDQALTAEKTGTGLGLSIARQLARGLGGDLRCEEREGGGAQFVLTLA